MAEADKTYTQAEYDAMIAERDALKANRDTILKEAKDAKKKLADYDGVDPVEFKALKDAAAEAERKKATAEGDFTKLKEQMSTQHQKELDGEKKKTVKALAALEKRKVAKLTEELAKAEALPEFMELLTMKGSASVRLREMEEDYEEYVADEKGDPLIADGKGTPMTIGQFVTDKLKAQYPGAFKGTGSSGGGASKSNAGGGGSRVIARDDNAAFLANLDGIADGTVTVGQ